MTEGTQGSDAGILHPADALGTRRAGSDRIFLRGHVRAVEIGAFGTERGRAQRVRFDLAAEVGSSSEAIGGDDVDGVLSYDAFLEAIDAGLAEGRVALLETLAERIAGHVLRHPSAARVLVRIEKLDLGPHGLGVEIVRVRDGVPPPPPAADGRTVVVLLAPGARDDVDLPAALDRLAGRPAVLVAAPDEQPPSAGDGAIGRRLALLAADAAAWRLAHRHPRLAVVETRTELDHRLRRGETVVWAPARLLLDAAAPPGRTAPEALARWLAATLGVGALVLPPGVAALPGPVRERTASLPDI